MDPDLIAEGILSKVVDKIKGRKVVGKTGSGGNIYVSTRKKPSKVEYKSTNPKQPEKKTSEIDHDDPWLKHSYGSEKKAHYRQMRGESVEEKRYCPLCNKRESRSECSYGEKAWDKVSVKDEEYSMARSELQTIHDALKRLEMKVGKGEGNLEAWVQSKITKAADYIDTAADYVSGGEMDEACWSGYKQAGMKKKGKKLVPNCVPEENNLEEATRIQAKTGNLMMVIAMWRGRSYSLKMFFPQAKLPSKKEVEEQIQKIYPGARVIYSKVCEREPGEPFFQVEDWQKVNKSDKTDGMSQAAVNAYRRENKGSKLKTAVTGDPKPGSMDAKRKKSFCARSEGQQDMHNIDCSKDPDKAICKARRRWKC
jgi:hypothetical protein